MICNTLLLRTKFQITPLLCLFFGFIGTDFIILRQIFNRPYQILCKDRLNVVPTLVDLFSISLQRKNNSAGCWCMGKHFQKSAEKTPKTFSSSEPYIGQVFYSWVNQTLITGDSRTRTHNLTFQVCFRRDRTDRSVEEVVGGFLELQGLKEFPFMTFFSASFKRTAYGPGQVAMIGFNLEPADRRSSLKSD